MPFGQAFRILITREFRIELRQRVTFYAVALLALLLILLFALLLSDDISLSVELKVGIWWSSVLLSGIWLVHQSIHKEHEQRTWISLWLAPFPRSALYATKSLVCTFQVFVLAVGLYPLTWWLFGWKITTWIPFVGLCLLGSLSIAWLGCLFAAATPRRHSAQWLSLLVYPLLVPALLCTVQGVSAASYPDALHTASAWRWLRLLLVFDGMVVLLGLWLFEPLSTPEES